MKLKTKKAIGILFVLILILTGAMTVNYYKLEKQNTSHLEIVEQQATEHLEELALEAKRMAELKDKEARKKLQIQLLDQKEKERAEAERKAEIAAQIAQQEKEQKEQIAAEQRKYAISTSFDKQYVPNSNCENPTSSLRVTMCTNERRKAKLEFEKNWDEQQGK